MPQQKWTGTGALAITFEVEPEIGIKMQETRLHLNNDSALVENFTVDLDAISGTQYDINLMTHSMQDAKDVTCNYDGKRIFKNDKLIFAWANTDGRTWGFEFIWDNFC